MDEEIELFFFYFQLQKNLFVFFCLFKSLKNILSVSFRTTENDILEEEERNSTLAGLWVFMQQRWIPRF